MSAAFDPRAVMAAQNNADWYAMMLDIRGRRYTRDADGFRAIDPPPPYHGWVTAVQGAAVAEIVQDYAGCAGLAIKDASGAVDLAATGLCELFRAFWLWHPPKAGPAPREWELIRTSEALLCWEKAWSERSPTNQRQFPDAILDRADVAIWGRSTPGGYDAGVIANLSHDCVGLSNLFGANARPVATQLCGGFGNGKPLVGYEQGDDLRDAVAAGWQTTGPLAVWAQSP